jgi:hypothetical protein
MPLSWAAEYGALDLVRILLEVINTFVLAGTCWWYYFEIGRYGSLSEGKGCNAES